MRLGKRAMKITDVTLTLFAWDDIPAVKYGPQNARIAGKSQLGLLAVETDAGVTGHAFLGAAMRGGHLEAHSLMEFLKPLLMGEDPLDRERHWQAMRRRIRATTWRAIGAMDIALWDIAGKVAGLPIHQLIGTCRHKVPTYGSSATLDAVEEYVEEALSVKAAGFAGYKIHPPADLGAHIDVCTAVREAVGDGYTLMLDSSMAYTFPMAMRVGRAIEELGYHWYEDPLAEDDMTNSAKLCQALDIPVMATEYAPGGFHSYVAWLAMGATDYLRGDVAVKGGITSILKTAHLAEGFHMNYEIHHGGNSLNNVANLHVMMAIPNCEFFEVLLPDDAQKFGLVEDIEVDDDGYVHAIDGPGLGAKIDFDLIAEKTIEVMR
jgi:L-alanine-DL-glutamate epimerase-like enolase superfamily enzyme